MEETKQVEIPEDLKSTYEYIERRNQMPFATTPYWERHARLIERIGRAEDALSQREFADKFDAPHDEALRSVIPAKYLGWSLKEAAAEYIKELKEALRIA